MNEKVDKDSISMNTKKSIIKRVALLRYTKLKGVYTILSATRSEDKREYLKDNGFTFNNTLNFLTKRYKDKKNLLSDLDKLFGINSVPSGFITENKLKSFRDMIDEAGVDYNKELEDALCKIKLDAEGNLK